MVLVQTVAEIQQILSDIRKSGKSIGFVPTMGALHNGHLSLVKKCKEQNDICVVSIFVNPTQFNDKNDYQKYPRTIERDSQLLESCGTDILFCPSEKDIYPETDNRIFDFGVLDKVMEGKFRPGHFNGVAQVVSRLFNIVKPGIAYFGEKDFQQLAIVRDLVKQLDIPVKIVGMPILREESGLAMSSRNERLTKKQRQNASAIYKALVDSLENPKEEVETVKQKVYGNINRVEDLNVEYFDIVDGHTLQPVINWEDTDYAVGCIAVFCGDVRLIDNITYFNRN